MNRLHFKVETPGKTFSRQVLAKPGKKFTDEDVISVTESFADALRKSFPSMIFRTVKMSDDYIKFIGEDASITIEAPFN